MKYEYSAIVLKVVDGDTLDAEVDCGFHLHITMRLRLYGINAPEMKGPSKEAGKASKAYLESLIAATGPEFVIRTVRDTTEKYGRYLATIIGTSDEGEEINLNKRMLIDGHAVKSPESWK